MEGTPVRTLQKPQDYQNLLRLTNVSGVASLQRELIALISEHLSTEVFFAQFDHVTRELRFDGSQSWLRPSLQHHPVRVALLADGQSVELTPNDVPMPRPIDALLSRILLVPVASGGSLRAVVGIAFASDAERPSPDRMETVASIARFAAPILARLLEIERLEATIEMRDHLQSNVAHELRTPLSAIRGYSRMILDGRAGDLNSTQKDYLNVVSDNSDRMIQLVTWMSQLSGLSAQHLQLTTFDLRDVWWKCRKKNEARLQEKSVTVIEHIPDETFNLIGDIEKLTYVFDTLLRGVAKFTRREGRITVQFSHGREMEASVKLSETGDGIPAEVLKKSFDRRANAHEELPPNAGPSEFSLSGVHDVVSLHGGRLFANSKAGEGSTFIFTLPSVNRNKEDNLGYEQTFNSGRRRR